MRDLKVPAYTIREAEQAAGLGVDNKQRGVEDVVKRMEGMSGVQEEPVAPQGKETEKAVTRSAGLAAQS
jgi:hypothetical protein